jgi:hypothetical protein
LVSIIYRSGVVSGSVRLLAHLLLFTAHPSLPVSKIIKLLGKSAKNTPKTPRNDCKKPEISRAKLSTPNACGVNSPNSQSFNSLPCSTRHATCIVFQFAGGMKII